MAIEKCCKNCACEYLCDRHENMSEKILCYKYDCFAPKEQLVRADERSKFITLLKSDLENYEGLANEYMKNNNIYDELIGNNAVRRYIEETIEVLKE